MPAAATSRVSRRSSATMRSSAVRALLLACLATLLMACGAVTRTSAAQAMGSGASIDPYRGLGAWIDIYDTKLYLNPPAAIRSLQARGVRTIYLQTSNSDHHVALVYPASAGEMIDLAHAAGMDVVAWDLPTLTKPQQDLAQLRSVLAFRTPLDEHFDSLGVDIESSNVKNVHTRTSRLLWLSSRLRSSAGSAYPLGAIIPSPKGMTQVPKYWPAFPYAQLQRYYDVWLPMDYASYASHDLIGAEAYTEQSLEILRGIAGADTPIHEVGGVTGGKKSAAITAGWALALTFDMPIGYSLYDAIDSSSAEWTTLSELGAPADPTDTTTPEPGTSTTGSTGTTTTSS